MQRNGKVLKKRDLPEKICAACGLSFRWRKKWQRCWDSVRYCSVRCKSAGKACCNTRNNHE